MHRARLERRRDAERDGPLEPAERFDALERRRSLRERARLVQRGHVRRGETLERVGARRQDPDRGQPARGDRQRHRGGERQRAGTRHDQHRDRRGNGRLRRDREAPGERPRGGCEAATTRTAAARSASSTKGARFARPRSTSLRICASADASAVAVTRSVAGCPRGTLPAATVSPAVLRRGQGSPVSTASSSSASARRTPSAGTASPGSTRTRSPGTSADADTRVSPPAASRRRAKDADTAAYRSRRAAAFSRARVSNARARSTAGTSMPTRVEVHGSRAAHGRGGAGEKRAGEADRDRHVHAGPEVAEVARGAGEELPPGVDEERERRGEAAPARIRLPERQPSRGVRAAHEIRRDGEVHDHHADESGEDQPRRVAPPRLGVERLPVARVDGPRPVADPAHGGENLRERETRGVPAHAHRLRGPARLGRRDAVERAQTRLVQPQARRAAHAVEVERRLPQRPVPRGRERLVDERLGLRLAAALLRRRGRLGAKPVVVVEALGGDRLGDRAAAGAAEVARRAEEFALPGRARRHRQAAVEAVGRAGGRNRRAHAPEHTGGIPRPGCRPEIREPTGRS